MSDVKPEAHQNVYLQNIVTGATPNPVIQNPDAIHQSPDITGQPVPKGEEIASLSYNYVLRVMTP
ncbi:MAG: hypothetical protein JGK24_32680, partial [Microcoleus sp. PH2017_29_MFU_D_A]|uniref:hypothetical protein n=1 Tax=unclassified Microcoleus TaxID=2642155 RepID=UPI001D8FF928